jgi:hypothetical protein
MVGCGHRDQFVGELPRHSCRYPSSAESQLGINIASTHGLVALVEKAAYVGAWPDQGCQGTTVPREYSVDQAKLELLAEKQPSHEFARPEQIGSLAVFLCSEAAAQALLCLSTVLGLCNNSVSFRFDFHQCGTASGSQYEFGSTDHQRVRDGHENDFRGGRRHHDP